MQWEQVHQQRQLSLPLHLPPEKTSTCGLRASQLRCIPLAKLLTCWTFCPLVTYSLPTFTRGWQSPLSKSAEFRPIK